MRYLANLFCVLILAAMSAAFASDVYQPPDPEPTPEETLILELMNRFRADPKAEASKIAPAGAATATYSGKGVDWKMFWDEVTALKPSPPLVFNLEFVDASPKHF